MISGGKEVAVHEERVLAARVCGQWLRQDHTSPSASMREEALAVELGTQSKPSTCDSNVDTILSSETSYARPPMVRLCPSTHALRPPRAHLPHLHKDVTKLGVLGKASFDERVTVLLRIEQDARVHLVTQLKGDNRSATHKTT